MDKKVYNQGTCYFLAQQGIFVIKPRFSSVPPPIDPVLQRAMDTARQEKIKRET